MFVHLHSIPQGYQVSKRASVVYCNFFWFGLAIGNFHFSPLLHFQNVLSVHLTGRTGAACVKLCMHTGVQLAASLLKAIYLPWIRLTLSKAATITSLCLRPMIPLG